MGVQAVRMDEAGVATVVDLTEGGKKTLEGLYDAIGCGTVDVVGIDPPRLDMWIDDEGLYAFEPVRNYLAEHVCQRRGRVTGGIVGAVVFAAVDGEGNTASLDDELREELLALSRRFQGARAHRLLVEHLRKRAAKLAEFQEARL